MKKYEQIAFKISQQITDSFYKVGDKLPSIRDLKKEFGVSISTIQQALTKLEDENFIEVKDRSGHYVKLNLTTSTPKLTTEKHIPNPSPVTNHQLTLDLIKATNLSDIIHFGAAIPSPEFLPDKEINKQINHIIKKNSNHSNNYLFPPGDPDLRTEIAIHMKQAGCNISPDEIIITNGCHEAICLALRAITNKGDVVAVETPTFYGLFQAIESIGLKAIEIPSDPETGINIGALKLALEKWDISALATVPNFNNPLGSLMPLENKKELYDLMQDKNIPIIEDDIYGDLSFSNQRPLAIKSFDTEKNENVIYCNSFSKTVSPGMRVGWIASKKLNEKIQYLKYVSNMSTSTISQMAMARYLKHGHHNRYLRNIRQRYSSQINIFSNLIIEHFPTGTRISRPQGGFVIWIELDKKIDTMKLYSKCIKEGISIAPGNIFSADNKYSNYLRINCAKEVNNKTVDAIRTIGDIANGLA